MQAVQIQIAEDHQFGPPIHEPQPHLLPLNDALHIRAAEGWLKLGEADQALRELEQLPQNTWNCPSVVKLRVKAMGMLRERREMVVAV